MLKCNNNIMLSNICGNSSSSKWKEPTMMHIALALYELLNC